MAVICVISAPVKQLGTDQRWNIDLDAVTSTSRTFAKSGISMLASTALRQMEKQIALQRANVVGVIHTVGGFTEAENLALDAVEVRLDALPDWTFRQQVELLPMPAILTVRRLEEGGVRSLNEEEQRELYFALLPTAAAVDVDIRSMGPLREMLEIARAEGKARILSFHDFEATPPLVKLRNIMARAREGGADVVKIATKTETPADVRCLLGLLEDSSPVAVMGIGSLGRASRLLFAKAGSVLNYGWLDEAQVAGQWSAREFLDLLARS